MRAFTPALIAASVAMALATAAQAQTNSMARPAAPSATTTTTANSPTISPSGTAGATAGTSISGTSTGDAFSGSSRGNVPPVGSAATAIPSATGINNTTTNSNTPGTVFNANGDRVGVINPDTGAIVNTPASAGATSGSDSGMAKDNAGAPNASSNVGAAATAVTPTPELDKAARREAEHARKTVERKGQMMQSVTPRTNVDRTDQMADDSSPLLSPSRR